jgi:hypothetical protein
MSRPLKIVGAGTFFLVAAGFLAVGCFAERIEGTPDPKWGLVFAAVCAAVGVAILLVKDPKRYEVEALRVEGAREPTYRLTRVDKGAKGEIWQLVLGQTECTLVRPDGSGATHFARQWAPLAIQLPGFVEGADLLIVQESWSPPEDESWASAGQLISDVRRVSQWGPDRNAPYYHFHGDKRLVPVIQEYVHQSSYVVGAGASQSFRIQGRRSLRGGAIGVAVGVPLVLYGAWVAGSGPGNSFPRILGLGIVISLIGAGRIVNGILNLRKASGTP